VHPSVTPGPLTPDWLVDEPYEDERLGTLKSGKEAEVFLVERRFTSAACLLAHKRYRPRRPSPGELRDLGFSNSTAYHNDSVYRAGWFLPARERRAVLHATGFGQRLADRLRPIQEWTMLERAWASGVSVPYPVELTDDGVLMEYVGDATMAAPRLAQAGLSRGEAADAWAQLLRSLRALTAAGVVHADLSAYNLLWWKGRLVVIDMPQAVEFTTNADAFDLLHRDVANIGVWFTRRGVELDVEEVYADLLAIGLYG